MPPTDQRNRLDKEVFSYRQGKDNQVFLFWQGKQVKICTGKTAIRFLEKIETVLHKEQQLMMAKLTGNFKHGNERMGKKKR